MIIIVTTTSSFGQILGKFGKTTWNCFGQILGKFGKIGLLLTQILHTGIRS